jgi:hypothetical protein
VTPNQIEEEVNKICWMLEIMESYKIITPKERANIRTKTKAWAFDSAREEQEDPNQVRLELDGKLRGGK